MKSYAEHSLDKHILETYFLNASGNTMLEVGAATPKLISMSQLFRENGWRTILVEPNPEFIRQHIELGNEIYPYAAGEEDKNDVDFTICTYAGKQHSFSSFKVIPEYITTCGFKNENDIFRSNIKVNMRKISSILEEANEKEKINAIDFLSIDIEGYEIQALIHFPWQKYSPSILAVENLLKNEEYNRVLSEIGYELVETIGEINQIYKLKK